MTWETLAPWMALAFTLALSILVPLFTQIANNRHQRKLLQEQRNFEMHQQKREVYSEFLTKVGSAITEASHSNMQEAGSAIYHLYAYAPSAWWQDLDNLALELRERRWQNASKITQKLSRLIAEDLDKER